MDVNQELMLCENTKIKSRGGGGQVRLGVVWGVGCADVNHELKLL